MKWNYLDLFSGIGGFRYGLELAGFEWGWTGHSEIDKYANQVYHRHWPESEDLGDVRTIDVSKLPRINLITFGFPCQDLSIAGKRGGLSANRSGLFFEAMRIVRDAKPDYFVFENVKGLFSSNGGFDWLNVLREVADSGYDGQWQLLNTRWFLPQNRERIFFAGYPSGTGGRQIFPVGEGNSTSDTEHREESLLQYQHSSSITSRQYKGGGQLLQLGTIGKDSEATIIYSPDGCARTLKDGGGMGAKTGLYEVTPLRWSRTEKGKEARRKSQQEGKDYTPFNEGHRELVEAEEPIAGCVTNALNKDALIGVKGGISNADAIEGNSCQVLFSLREEIGEEAFTEWGFRLLDSLQPKEVLQSDLHGKSISDEAISGEHSSIISEAKSKDKETEWRLRDMWETTSKRCSSQGWKLSQQLNRELNAYLQELSQQDSYEKKILCDLWFASKGIGVLQQALLETQETWKPFMASGSGGTGVGRRIRRLTPL